MRREEYYLEQTHTTCHINICFLSLKGIFNKDHVSSEVKAMIADLQLLDKTNIQASRLSGGMKRKLRYIYMYIT